MPERLIIIGGGVAGISVASYVNQRAPDIEITIFTREKDIGYSLSAMPSVLAGDIPLENLAHNAEYYKDMGVEVHPDSEVTAIGLEDKYIIANGKRFSYDKLVIATGASPVIPQIPGVDKKGVFCLKTLDDGKRLQEAVDAATNAVVAGANRMGLEIAAAFAASGINTTVVEALPYVLPQNLDPDMATIVQSRLEHLGMRVITGYPLGSINGAENVEFVTVGKEILPADIVFISCGLSPNTSLAGQAGIPIRETGGVKVNSSVQALDGIYAVGGCAEAINYTTSLPCLSMLETTAVQQARVAAANICGEKSEFGTVLNSAVAVIGGMQVGSTGLTSYAAKRAGLTPVVGKARGRTRAEYYPDKKEIHIKLLFAEERLIGAQIISEEGAKERVDALSLGIKSGMTLQQLLHVETCYAPPVSAVVDVFTLALEDAARQL